MYSSLVRSLFLFIRMLGMFMLMQIGGNFGSGKRSGGVSTLICAVLDDRKATSDDDEPKYTTPILYN